MKKATGILALLLCFLLLTACGGSPAPAPEEKEGAGGWQAVTLTDQAGREVTIEKEPQQIVSGYYITTSLLIALDKQDSLVGIEAKADIRNIYSLAAPELLELPNVGSAKDFHLEGCIALEPDLVILPLKLADAADALAQLNIPVLLVNPESSQLLEEAITLIAQATGAQERGQALLDYYADKHDELDKLLEGAQEQPTVYLAGNSDMLSTATASMYQDTLITEAGGQNVAAEVQDNYWATISYEQLIAWDPDYIVIVPEAVYTAEDVVNTPQLASLSAVQEGRVYAMPSAFEAWDSPVPSGILGTLWMASLLHPDLYAFSAMQDAAADFYQTFYGFTPDKASLTQ